MGLTKVACVAVTESSPGPELIESVKTQGYFSIASRHCEDVLELAVILSECAGIIKMSEVIGIPTEIGLFLTKPIVLFLSQAGITLQHSPTKVNVFVQEDEHFVQWGYFSLKQ
jgi:hypothetical protein